MREAKHPNLEEKKFADSRARVERTAEIMAKRAKRVSGAVEEPIHLIHERAKHEETLRKLNEYSELEVEESRGSIQCIRGVLKGKQIYVSLISTGLYVLRIDNKTFDQKTAEKVWHHLHSKMKRVVEARKYIKEAKSMDEESGPYPPSLIVEEILADND